MKSFWTKCMFGLQNLLSECVLSRVFWLAEAGNEGRFSQKRTVLKIPPYEHLAGENLNCRNPRKTTIIQGDKLCKESNGAISDRHDRTWSITRDSHTSNVYGTKQTVGHEYQIVTSDPDFRLQRPQKPLINVTLVEYFAVWMHLFTFVTITSAMYFHNRS